MNDQEALKTAARAFMLAQKEEIIEYLRSEFGGSHSRYRDFRKSFNKFSEYVFVGCFEAYTNMRTDCDPAGYAFSPEEAFEAWEKGK